MCNPKDLTLLIKGVLLYCASPRHTMAHSLHVYVLCAVTMAGNILT